MLMAEYLLFRPKKMKVAMPIIRAVSLFTFLFILSNQLFAQAISKDYQKNCVREQVSEHQGTKGKALTADDFSAYCSCQAEYISQNATKQQVNELVKNPKAKPDWLKVIELKAMKSCIPSDSKMNT